MLKLENTEVMGWEAAIRGMRNPKNSWEKSDSKPCWILKDITPKNDSWRCAGCKNEPLNRSDCTVVGPNDYKLMMQLRNAGTDHRKFMRMIAVYVDITAPLYWWKEFKTYRTGRRFADDEPDIIDTIDEGYLEYDIEMNSCSTMHKIADKEFTLDDFSHEHLINYDLYSCNEVDGPVINIAPHIGCGGLQLLDLTISVLNYYRSKYLATEDKTYWWQMIQLLPSSYNQRRTVMLNYEVLANMYKSRRHHKLDEWHTFCDWIEGLPYSELITGANEVRASAESGGKESK